MKISGHITATAAALAFALCGGIGIAQQTAPSPAGPTLVAPHTATFKTNSADVGPSNVPHAAWVAAIGNWETSTEDGMLESRARFSGLVPGGNYSLFLRHVAKGTMVIEPIDASGSTDTFVASPAGTAATTMTIAQSLVTGDEVLLIYRTARPANLKKIGHIGVDAFIQLRLKQP